MKKTAFFMTTLFLCAQLVTRAAADYDRKLDYLDIMLRAAACSDFEAGYAAEICRNEYLDDIHSEEVRFTFDDLYWLAKVICSEAGSDFLCMEWKMCVGEVVLNRVASPEFPDTVYDVIFQEGQYANVDTEEFLYGLDPSPECVTAALRLLQGERLLAPWVVFQANFPQGGGTYTMYFDSRLGYTYFCSSPNPELY